MSLRMSYTWLSRVRSEIDQYRYLSESDELTAAPKPNHRALPNLASRSPSDALSILFLAMTNKASASAQAIQATSEAKIVRRNATTSMNRLLQHHAKKAKINVRKAKPAAIEVKVSDSMRDDLETYQSVAGLAGTLGP
jgi:hypothetical protein